jgi:hypothetical protein
VRHLPADLQNKRRALCPPLSQSPTQQQQLISFVIGPFANLRFLVAQLVINRRKCLFTCFIIPQGVGGPPLTSHVDEEWLMRMNSCMLTEGMLTVPLIYLKKKITNLGTVGVKGGGGVLFGENIMGDRNGIAGGVIYCQLCPYENRYRRTVESHVQANHLPGFPGVRCTLCTKISRTYNAFLKHRERYHINKDG